MSREGPEAVDPVEIAGIRYEAIHWGKVEGLGQNGGYIRATDVADDRELWTLKLYDIDYTEDMEPDRLDCFVTRIREAAGATGLIVDDEKDRCFKVDLATRTVEQLA